MASNPRTGRSTVESISELVDTPTGTEVEPSHVVLLDPEDRQWMGKIVIGLMAEGGTDAVRSRLSAWKQEDGSIHMRRTGAVSGAAHLAVRGGQWRFRTAEELEKLTRDAQNTMSGPGAKHLEALVQRERDEAEALRREVEASDVVVLVLDRTANGLSLLGRMAANQSFESKAKIDAWYMGGTQNALIVLSTRSGMRSITGFDGLDDFVTTAIPQLDLANDPVLRSSMLMTPFTPVVYEQYMQAWLEAARAAGDSES